MTTAAPIVSIVVPCHNAKAWIGQCLASARGQQGITPEVIVVDDGSTDGSAREIAEAGPDIVSLRFPTSRGGNAARNAGLARATGNWVQFLDADDYLEPEKIARQLREAGKIDRVDVLYSPVWVERWRDGRAVAREASLVDSTTDLFTQWIRWQLPQTGGALWRASSLRRMGGWNESLPCCQEHELYLRALKAGLEWRFCPSAGAIYRLWSETTVCRADPLRVIRTRTMLIDDALAWLEGAGRLQPAHRAAAAQVGFELARMWARQDLAGASDYLETRRRRTGLRLRGPAAPLHYRLAFHVLGFRGAEELARRLR